MCRDKFGQTRSSSEAPQNEKLKSTTTADMWKKLKSKDSSSSSQTARSFWNPKAELNHYLEMVHVTHDPRLHEEEEDVDLLGCLAGGGTMNANFLLYLSSQCSSSSIYCLFWINLQHSWKGNWRKGVLQCAWDGWGLEALTCLKDSEAADTRQQHQLEDQEIAQALADLELEDE